MSRDDAVRARLKELRRRGAGLRRSDYYKDVGKRLSLLREVLDRTQGQIADDIDVDRTAWNKFENGEALILPIYALRLCNRFKISMDYIYRGVLTGVQPSLAYRLAERDPQLLRNTNHAARETGSANI